MATRKKLPATLAVAALTATLYGCGGGGDNRFVDLEDQLGTALTAESLKELQDERDAARAAQRMAEEARRMAESERDAANMAQMTAEEAQRNAEAAQMTAEEAQRNAEAAQMTAEEARRMAEGERDAANMDKMTAEEAQRNAEEAQRMAEEAKRVAERDRDEARRQRDAANTAADEAEEAQRNAEEAQRMAEEAKRMAERDRDEARRQRDAANTAADEADEAKRMADEAKRMADEAKRMAERDRDEAQRQLKDLQDKIAGEKRVAMVEAVRLAVTNNRVGSSTSPLPFSSNPKASRDSDGMVTIELSASTPGDGPFSDGSAAAGDGMWTDVGLMRDRSMTNSASNKSDTIVIYTDVEAPMDVELLESEGSTAGGVEFVLITAPAHRDDGSPTEASGRIRYMELDNPPATGSALTYQNNGEFGGMYRGISGTFRCVGGSCGITKGMNNDGEDVLMFVSGPSSEPHSNRLRFIPDDEEATYSPPDMKYTYFGWWLEKGVAGNPEQIAKLRPFHGGVGKGHTVNVGMAVTGTARYTGQAHGRYVTTAYDQDGKLAAGQQTQHGLFEATAVLTADFEDATSLGSISGVVNDFKDAGGDKDGWSVTLREMSVDAAVGGETDVRFGGFNYEKSGKWEARFHDPGEDPSDAPGTITGIFDAVVGGVGLLTGGFGAKQ